MSALILPFLAILGSITAVAGLSLFVYKLIRHRRERFDEFRRASYIGALSEMATRSGYPLEMLRRWSPDGVFLETLLEFLKFLQGGERQNLLRLARELGIVERFVNELRTSTRRNKRVEAVKALAEFADPASADALLETLKDPVDEVRWQGAGALAKIGDPRAVRPLLETLQRETDWGANRIADTLVAFGSTAVPDLARYALLSDPVLSANAAHLPLIARVLGIIGDVRAEPAMLSALEADDAELRIRAAAALGTVGSLTCVPPLIRTLRDPEWEVRAQAAAALGRQMDGRAIEGLRRSMRDENWWVRQNSAQALSEIPGGITALVGGLEDEDRFARDASIERLMAMGLVRKAVEAVKGGSAGEQDRFVVRQMVVLGRGEYLRDKAADEKVAG
ncbi:MAG: HEAT repeat domain-containing protein [Acidimicrobiia bacterium]|nr:HEAT repeat domain-containing protein [Acidimicrobiia bacterium]